MMKAKVCNFIDSSIKNSLKQNFDIKWKNDQNRYSNVYTNTTWNLKLRTKCIAFIVQFIWTLYVTSLMFMKFKSSFLTSYDFAESLFKIIFIHFY